MFLELKQDELLEIDGGLFPLILFGGAIVITKGAAIAGGLFAVGVGIGVAWAFHD